MLRAQLLHTLWYSLPSFCVAQDFVTLRYYGQEDNFRLTQNWPKESEQLYGYPSMSTFVPDEVCRTFMAVCINLRFNECVKAPLELRAPWTRNFTDRDPGRYIFDPPYESEPGSYMIFTGLDVKYEAETTQHEGRQLFSGCDQGCHQCTRVTGCALHPVYLPNMCHVTEYGGVFSLLYNHNSSQFPAVNTEFNCVGSLADYYEDLEESNALRGLITGIICVAILLILAVVFAAVIFTFRKQRARMEVELMAAIHEGRAQFNVGQGPLLCQREIEASFPITSVKEEPTCVVCLAVVAPEQRARKLQCDHVFHADCILSWWTHRPRRVIQCPVCRRPQSVLDAAQVEVAAFGESARGNDASPVAPQVLGVRV